MNEDYKLPLNRETLSIEGIPKAEVLKIKKDTTPRAMFPNLAKGYSAFGFNNGCFSFIIPACAVDAPHRRDRVWILANSSRTRTQNVADSKSIHAQRFKHRSWEVEPRGSCKNVANTQGERCREKREYRERSETRTTGGSKILADSNKRKCKNRQQAKKQKDREKNKTGLDNRPSRHGDIGERGWWSVEPNVGRVATRIPGDVDRLKQLGNAVVPQIPEIIGRAIIEYEKCI